jgi:hypothetical protein
VIRVAWVDALTGEVHGTVLSLIDSADLSECLVYAVGAVTGTLVAFIRILDWKEA